MYCMHRFPYKRLFTASTFDHEIDYAAYAISNLLNRCIKEDSYNTNAFVHSGESDDLIIHYHYPFLHQMYLRAAKYLLAEAGLTAQSAKPLFQITIHPQL